MQQADALARSANSPKSVPALAYVLAVVHVETYAVSQTMGHEEESRARGQRVVDRTAHQPQIAQTLDDGAECGVGILRIHHVGMQSRLGFVVRRQHYIIYILLFLRESAAHGEGSRVVRHIVVEVLAARVAQQQTAVLQNTRMVVVVQHLAVLRKDGRERYSRAVRHRHAVHRARDLMLAASRAGKAHSGGVHAVAYVESLFQSRDLLRALALAHLRHGEEQVERLAVVEHARGYAEHIRQLQFGLAAVGRQVVHCAALLYGATHVRGEGRHRLGVRHAHLRRQIGDGGLRSHPYYVVHGEVVAVERLRARVGVDYARQHRHVVAEKVEERRVLTEMIGVVRIVHGRLRVAREQDQSVTDSAAKALRDASHRCLM